MGQHSQWRDGISIHAPREGCDYGGRDWYQSLSISIHAPREGCDDAMGWILFFSIDFNPRTP